MSNMSYCRFENTLGDLRDCRDAFYDDGFEAEMSSNYERIARLRLLQEVKDWAEDIDEDELEAEENAMREKGIIG